MKKEIKKRTKRNKERSLLFFYYSFYYIFLIIILNILLLYIHIYIILLTNQNYKIKIVMCLIVKRIRHLNGKAKIAKRNIPCLKVLLFSPSEKKLMTPFMRTSITELEVKDGLYADQFVYQTKFRNIENGIHSYKKKYPFFGIATRMYSKYAHTITVNAYIPKGTKYWIGKGGEYVSECIKFN